MKALIKKDFYTLFRQMKIYLLFIIVFACLPGYSTSTFAIVYAAMLPITALAYDERCKWAYMAVMMPYSEKDIVLGKYVFGYAAILLSVLCSTISSVVFNLYKGISITSEVYYGNLGVLLVGSTAIAILLPIMFRFGVEKGRIVMIVLIAVFVGAITAIGKFKEDADFMITFSTTTMVVGAVALIVILTGISILLSLKWYRKKYYV